MSSYAVTDPTTGETVAEHPEITDAELQDALAAAEGAYRGWSRRTSVAQRAALVARVAELHTERRDELARIIVIYKE